MSFLFIIFYRLSSQISAFPFLSYNFFLTKQQKNKGKIHHEKMARKLNFNFSSVEFSETLKIFAFLINVLHFDIYLFEI
jgi:hypothetical protein